MHANCASNCPNGRVSQLQLTGSAPPSRHLRATND
jgi:hypothetical protein